MGLPKFVEELDEKANKIIEELQNNSSEQEESSDQDQTGIPDDVIQAPEKETVTEDKQTQTVQANTETNKLLEELESWKHKYEVLQYKYNAEVPRMAEEIRQLKEQLNSLATSQQRYESKEVPETLESFKMEYPEIYEAMEEMMSAKLKEITSKYVEEINKLKAELGSKVDTSLSKTREAFIARMDKELPNWREINVDPKFIEWLNVPDKYTGIPKIQLLRKAWEDLDFERSIVFFTDYLAATGQQKKPPTFPNKTQSSQPQTEAQQYLTPQDITKLSRKIQQLINEQKYEEANKLEKKLDEILRNKINT